VLARVFVGFLLISGGIGFVTDVGPSISEAFSDWISSPAVSGTLAPWVVLSAIMIFYLQRIFNYNTPVVVASLFGVMGLIAVLSWNPRIVDSFGYSGWLFWCLLIVVLIRVDHPEVEEMEPLSPGRKALAIFGLIIFALCFSIKPLYFV